MAKKTKSKTSAKRSSKEPRAHRADRIDPRKKLLARVAGSVAASIVLSPSPATTSAEGIAEVAVGIAEQILRKAGVHVPSASTPAGPSTDSDEAVS